MSRVDLLRTYAAAAAIMDACARDLKGAAEEEFKREGTPVSWRPPGVATVSTALNNSTVEVTDEERLMDWLEHMYPDEVIKVRAVRSNTWRAAVLAALVPVDPDEIDPGDHTLCMDREGTIVPGVAWRKGGTYKSTSITVAADLKRSLAQAAAAYVRDGTPLPTIDGPVRLALAERAEQATEDGSSDVGRVASPGGT